MEGFVKTFRIWSTFRIDLIVSCKLFIEHGRNLEKGFPVTKFTCRILAISTCNFTFRLSTFVFRIFTTSSDPFRVYFIQHDRRPYDLSQHINQKSLLSTEKSCHNIFRSKTEFDRHFGSFTRHRKFSFFHHSTNSKSDVAMPSFATQINNRNDKKFWPTS